MLSGSISILQSADVNLSGFLVEKMLTQEKEYKRALLSPSSALPLNIYKTIKTYVFVSARKIRAWRRFFQKI
jgi:hypothetical protein